MPSPCYECEFLSNNKNAEPCLSCEKRIDYAISEGMYPIYNWEREAEAREEVENTCSEVGCESKVKARGLCEKHYKQWNRNNRDKVAVYNTKVRREENEK